MGKHDLTVSSSRRPEMVPVEVCSPVSVKRKPTETSKPSPIHWDKLGTEGVHGMLEIAKMVVAGRRDIAVIQANADAEVKKIETEIKQIVAEAESYVKKHESDAKCWNERFDRKADLVKHVLNELERHPDWSESVKEKVMDLAIKSIEQ